ncbi:MAG: transcription antitermination factor NusB, partial [Pseudomonadota bacterium]
ERMAMEDALAASTPFDALEGSDRGFARAIAGATLRALGRIDRSLSQLVDRPLEKMDAAALAVLRVGAAQLWVLETPAYASVSATVEAARQWEPANRSGGLVNAVLRRADRERSVYDDIPASTIWPDWLAARLKSGLGSKRADALASLQLQEPSTDISVKSDPEAWARKLDARALPSGSVRLPTGAPITQLDGYADGDWWVQDAGAALAATLFGDLSGRRVADLCAAPGGKTLQLSALGAHVAALDISEPRLDRMRENLDRTKLEATIIAADAAEWRPKAPLDAILLDAPCSALGTLRRHPEGAWRRDPKRLARYPKTQTKLLNAAHDMLKSGGRLVYCVCTPLPEEGVEIVDAGVKRGDWRRVPICADEVPGFAHGLTEAGDLITAPPVGSASEAHVLSDVFQIIRLQKA